MDWLWIRFYLTWPLDPIEQNESINFSCSSNSISEFKQTEPSAIVSIWKFLLQIYIHIISTGGNAVAVSVNNKKCRRTRNVSVAFALKCHSSNGYKVAECNHKWTRKKIISELLLFAYQDDNHHRRRAPDSLYNDDVLHSVSIYIRRIGSKHLHKNVRPVSFRRQFYLFYLPGVTATMTVGRLSIHPAVGRTKSDRRVGLVN